jgi:peptidoglycan/xylan/chitin deacetylase (PgdA/CDA1 family)
MPVSASALPATESKPVTRHGSALIISLDFELHWGVRDRFPLTKTQSARLLAARAVIPRILDLFEEFSINATWATVGFLFAHSRQEAEAFTPLQKPSYQDDRLNAYGERLGKDEREDPFHFAPSIIAQIAARRGQEIGSHSFSHYYCVEAGQTVEDFEADVNSAVAIAANGGYTLRSFVFPRNQVNPSYLPLLKRAGVLAYRGNEPARIKRSAAFVEQQRVQNRIGRLLDSYVDICGPQTIRWPEYTAPVELAASRYLRPYHPATAHLQRRQLGRIAKALKHAALHGEIFHLWWHPEDFAPHLEQNLHLLRRALEIFDQYRNKYAMVSLSMAQASGKVSAPPPQPTF